MYVCIYLWVLQREMDEDEEKKRGEQRIWGKIKSSQVAAGGW